MGEKLGLKYFKEKKQNLIKKTQLMKRKKQIFQNINLLITKQKKRKAVLMSNKLFRGKKTRWL